MALHLRFALAISILAAAMWLALWVAALMVFSAFDADAHDWYPTECCSGIDCAPVESWSYVASAFFDAQDKKMSMPLPRLVVTTKRGTFVIPDDLPRRVSQDNRMHVCNSSTGKVLCVFEPPGM